MATSLQIYFAKGLKILVGSFKFFKDLPMILKDKDPVRLSKRYNLTKKKFSDNAKYSSTSAKGHLV